MHRGVEGSETACSLVMKEFKDDVLSFGICFDGRLRVWSYARMECILVLNTLENTAENGQKLTPGGRINHLILGIFLINIFLLQLKDI